MLLAAKTENKKSITECRHSPIVIKKCHDMFVTHMARRHVPFLTVKVDDALYEECRCKAFVDAQNVLAVGASEFLLCKFLAVAKVNLRTSLHELVPARDDMWFTKFMASDACGHAWHLLMQSYMMELWPRACSLCCRSQQTHYVYQHNVDTFPRQSLEQRRRVRPKVCQRVSNCRAKGSQQQANVGGYVRGRRS